ncbi:hypothetical protein EVAR_50822_1 [Eumeta japonica]|uniref:Uncharacterized protein n=1 Tax=Eumeta variegata TaxID=151549 RepID=A0A4C1XE06_EUMVA|nr:hypothetical protein EVAR_50822_1 [Eumeta japonica]
MVISPSMTYGLNILALTESNRNQKEWATLAQNKTEMKEAVDELYQLSETDTESSALITYLGHILHFTRLHRKNIASEWISPCFSTSKDSASKAEPIKRDRYRHVSSHAAAPKKAFLWRRICEACAGSGARGGRGRRRAPSATSRLSGDASARVSVEIYGFHI